MVFKIILVLLFVTVICQSRVTEKQYASMPTLFHLEDFDNCMMYGDEALYCYFKYELQPIDNKNPGKIWKIIEEVSSSPTNYRHDHLRHGICVTTSCPNIKIPNVRQIANDTIFKNEVAKCYDVKYKNMGLRGKIDKIHCETKEPHYPIDLIDIAAMVFYMLYIGFIIFSSFYEGIARYKTPEEYKKITSTFYGKLIAAFSIPRNWYRLKEVKDTEEVNTLRAIQGIRYYNIICVVLAHTVFAGLAGPVSNPPYVEGLQQKTLNLFLASGGYAVQTFFLISGWLLIYQFFVAFENNKQMKFKHLVMAFIGRYIRLTPSLFFVILFHTTWLRHISRGPIWHDITGKEYLNCRKNWWTNLLYINYYVDNKNMCMVQSWYLSADTQYFIMELLLVWLMWKNKKHIPVILSTLLIGQTLLLFVVAYIKDVDAAMRPHPEVMYGLNLIRTETWLEIIGSAYGNASGFIEGLAFGYVFYKYRHIKLFTKKMHVAIWWILTFGLPLGIIILPGVYIYDVNYVHNRLFAAIYTAIGRPIFGFGIGLGIFGTTQGIGWMMKWTTQWPPTYVLGRLTYSIFLVHTIFPLQRVSSLRNPMYLTDMNLLCELLLQMTISTLLGLFLTLMVELPTSDLMKLLIPSKDNDDKVSKRSEDKTK